jgi:DNA-binding NarL/FixJ family response regulator
VVIHATKSVLRSDSFPGRFCGVKKARIVVADDHAITLAGLRMVIADNSDFELVGEAKSGPHEDRRYLNEAMQAGVRGFVLKSSTTECLVRAVRGVSVGGLYIDPAVAGNMFERSGRSTRRREPRGAALTEREADVLKHVALGLTSKQIAFRLDLSAKSVETYKARALAKIGGKTRADIVRYASLQGWLGKI